MPVLVVTTSVAEKTQIANRGTTAAILKFIFQSTTTLVAMIQPNGSGVPSNMGWFAKAQPPSGDLFYNARRSFFCCFY